MIKNPIYKIFEADSKILVELQAKFEREIGKKLPENLAMPQFIGNDKLKLELAVRMIFSALVDADFLDTETHYQAKEREKLSTLNPAELLAKLETARAEKSRNAIKKGIDAKLLETRNRIYASCLAKAEEKQGFFSLTVPTGGAKTLSSMAFALRHAEIHNLRRVIVVIPYLSIIEQNADEYQKILDPQKTGLIVEHHSALKVESEESEAKRGSERRKRSPLELAAENWDAPVIVTTSVQFIESLFSNIPSRCRKLHNIARSVIIFDEIQTLPAHLLEPLLGVWRELAENYGVSFVFSSATQPAFKKQFNLKNGFADNELREITEGTNDIYQSLRRVCYELPQPSETKTLAQIAAEMSSVSQVLCVVNTRKQAFELWSELNRKFLDATQDGPLHLSSAMCAKHRLQVIAEIKRRLRENLPCSVVSTQLVEAGVDLDFPVLFRALAPLDSIVQSAGRCNREGKLPEKGIVKVFLPAEHALPPGIYKTATQITASLLDVYDDEKLSCEPNIFGDYFSRIYQMSETGLNIEAERKNLNFREVAKAVKVIEDAGVPVVVPFEGENGQAMKIVQEIRERNRYVKKLWFGKDDLRRLQRFFVNVRTADFQALQAIGQTEFLINENLEIYVAKEGSYHEKLGLLRQARPTEEFIL